MTSDATFKQDAVDSTTTPKWSPGLLPILVGAILGGLIGFFIINQVHPKYPRPELPPLGAYPSQELLEQYRSAELEFHRRNGAVDCGLLGGCLGILIGLTASRRRLLGGPVGLILGGLAGVGLGYLVGQFVAQSINQSDQQSITQSTIFHAIIFAGLGMAIWGSLTLLHRPNQIVQAIVLSLVGGLVGAILYNSICSIVYPLSNLSIITPESTAERIIWAMSCSIGLGVFWALGSRTSTKQPAASVNVPA